MRTRIAHTLSLVLLGAVALSVVAMGGWTAWNLRQGFNHYLQSRDIERLDRFVEMASASLSAGMPDQVDARRDADRAPADRPDLRALLREFAQSEGLVQTARPGPGPMADHLHRPGQALRPAAAKVLARASAC